MTSSNQVSSVSSATLWDLVQCLFKLTSSTKSEIICAFTCIHGYKDNSTQYFGRFLCPMCPTSPKSQDFKIRPIKWMYVTNIGFYPYYKNLLIDGLAKTLDILVMFNKSLNEVCMFLSCHLRVLEWINTL